METLFEIIHEDADLLVVNKPAGLVCHPTKGDQFSSLISRARLHCGTAAHLVNRLDRETSGIVLLAKNSETAGALGKLWENRAVQKEYLAIVHGHVLEKNGIIDAPLGKDVNSIVAVKDCVRADGASAQTEFELLKQFTRDAASPDRPPLDVEGSMLEVQRSPLLNIKHRPQKFSLLRVVPRTGRKHQIRIHLAHAGFPIVGDKLYGHDEDAYLALVENRLTEQQRNKLIFPNQALHAASITLNWRGKDWNFSAPPENYFQNFIT